MPQQTDFVSLWSEATDEELLAAAGRFAGLKQAAQVAILSELGRRGLRHRVPGDLRVRVDEIKPARRPPWLIRFYGGLFLVLGGLYVLGLLLEMRMYIEVGFGALWFVTRLAIAALVVAVGYLLRGGRERLAFGVIVVYLLLLFVLNAVTGTNQVSFVSYVMMASRDEATADLLLQLLIAAPLLVFILARWQTSAPLRVEEKVSAKSAKPPPTPN